MGRLPETVKPTVAIVGSRKPTSYGREVAQRISYDLAQAGVIIVSGLALGIDGVAHRGALEAGGTTIAVLGNGLDSIYPSSHQDLGQTIIEKGGAIISEYEPAMPALAYQFLERNRIVSGLSDAVVVVEAAARSGTLSTAAHALNQGREVFAVPGNITSPLSTGCNNLIKQGATPVTSSDDILEIIAPQIKIDQAQLIFGDTVEEVAIIDLLKAGLRDGEDIQIKSQLTPEVFNQTLSMLEIKGIIRPLGANQWTLR